MEKNTLPTYPFPKDLKKEVTKTHQKLLGININE